jgi:hypothetical protein
MAGGQFQGRSFLVDFGAVEMLYGNALCFGALVGLLTESPRELLAMIGEIDVTNLLGVEVGIDAAMVAQEGRFAAEAETVETGEDEVDQRGKTC